MHALLHSVPPTLQQTTTNPRLCWIHLDTHGHVWVSLLWGHCSFLLGPGAHKILFVLSKSLFPQSYVSSGGSMVGLMVTYSKSEVKVTQLCPTLCDAMDYTVHGILQARTLEWVAFYFSRGSSQPRD